MATKPKINRADVFTSILSKTRAPTERSVVRHVPLAEIRPSPNQPRRYLDQEMLDKLAASIKAKGVLQPLLVREAAEGFELVAGERRYHAAERVGLDAVPAIVLDLTDEEALEIALMENLNREDLNPVEETDSTLKLLSLKLKKPVEEIIEIVRVGYYRAQGRDVNTGVYNAAIAEVERFFEAIGRFTISSFYSHRLPILKFPDEVLKAVREGQIEYSKAKLLAGLEDEPRSLLLQRAINERLGRQQLREEIAGLKQGLNQQPAAELSSFLTRVKRKLAPAKVGKLTPSQQRKLDRLLKEIDELLA